MSSTTSTSSPHHYHLLDGTHLPHNIAFYAFGIGIVFGIGISIVVLGQFPLLWLGLFFITLASFHLLEYLITAMYNFPKLSLQSYLIPHSTSYIFANLFAIIESCVYLIYFPLFYLSIPWYIRCSGILLILIGQYLRSSAMIQAGTNFSHNIEYTKRHNHTLVTTGVYSYFRHPSYFAFYWWSIGTQLLLANPISLLGYTIILSLFFRDRILYEEQLLIYFFGEQYRAYQSKVHVWIPFV